MILSKHRFRGRRDPRIVLKHGKTMRDGYFQLKYLHKNDQDTWRSAVIVSTKVTKSAPKRNRIRRRIYEILRKQDIKPGTDFIVLVYDDKAASADAGQLKNSLLGLLNKANLL